MNFGNLALWHSKFPNVPYAIVEVRVKVNHCVVCKFCCSESYVC